MLTKDLLRYKIQRPQIRPVLIKPEDATLLDLAEELITLFETSTGETREALGQSVQSVIDSFPKQGLIARGLEKLLLDRTEFETGVNEDLLSLRARLFEHTSQWLSSPNLSDLSAYHAQVQHHFQHSYEALAAQLYSDLPPYQKILYFKPTTAERLLHRYNCAQVQGLLIRTERLELEVGGNDPGLLRQLFKYLKFYQLLAQITPTEAERYRIVIDGPLSLFYQTQKYGFNLAFFFPAILNQQSWQIIAQVQWEKTQSYTLRLDETCGIRSHYRNFLAYIPPEIGFLQNTFGEKNQDWELQPAMQFVPLAGEDRCFPDYWLKHRSGRQVALELFHGWHSRPLLKRLEQVAALSHVPLLLGVAKSLLQEAELAEAVHHSAYFQKYGFTFREMPTTEKLLPLLQTWLKTK